MPPRRRAYAAASSTSLSAAFASIADSFTGHLRTTVGVSLVAFIGIVAAHYFLGEAAVVGRMAAAFEVGGAQVGLWAPSLPWDVEFRANDALATVPRPVLVANLTALMCPERTAQYALVVGESGTGKSTAVRNTVRSLPSPKGAIYFSTPVLVASFSSDLARAVGYAPPFDPLASVFGWLGGQASSARADGVAWPELFRALQKSATRFHAMHARPAVLVIDAVDFVAKEDPAFFLQLQDFAKVCADMGTLRVVFVSSEGVVLPLMRASSAWSRALPPFEVQDIDDALAVDYLVDRGMAHPMAEEAVRTVTGGRFALLLHVASAAVVKPIADIRNELDIRTDSTLKELGFSPTHELFRALIAVGRFPSNKALDLLLPAELAALLKANIIALHPDGAYTVHARHVESFLLGKGAKKHALAQMQAEDGERRLVRRAAERAATSEEREGEGGDGIADEL
jgi:hypothetical protein